MNVKTSILVVEMVLWYVAAPSSSYFVIVEVFTKFLINSWQAEVTSSTQFAGSDVPNDLDLSDVLVNQLIESIKADFVPVRRISEEVHQSFTKSSDLPQCIWVFSCIRRELSWTGVEHFCSEVEVLLLVFVICEMHFQHIVLKLKILYTKSDGVFEWDLENIYQNLSDFWRSFEITLIFTQR